MAKLPYSRVVNVYVLRNDKFPAKRGFGTPILLTTQSVPGVLDASHRTKLYASMDEIAVDWNAGDSFYDAALQGFSQNPRPTIVKAGYVDVGTGDDGNDMKDQLDSLYDADNDWYWIGIERGLRDTVFASALIEWTEAKSKFSLIDSNDADMENAASSASIAAAKKGTVVRSAIFYDTDPDQYPGFALACRNATFNLDEANSAYTDKYKRLTGLSPIDKTSSVITAITGFVPGIGQSTTAGHCGMCYIDIGDQDFTVEGSTLTPNVFIDEIHVADWLVARTEEEMLAVKLNNNRIPFDDEGMEMLASAARTVMAQARRAGLIANDYNPETGKYEPAVIFEVPSALSVPASQRKARIAPKIVVKFRYVGAVHYATVEYQMNF